MDGITKDMDGIAYNSVVSKLMVLMNAMVGVTPLPREVATTFVRLL